jgi:hypothetical protein
MGKQKFTQKRRPYKKYNLADWKWEDIFFEIDELSLKMNQGYIKIVSEKYGILHKTLYNKYNEYVNNKTIHSDTRGGKNKIFTESEESDIFNLLKSKFIDKEIAVCNEDIKVIAKEKYKKIYNDNKFTASNGWCNGFKKRWNLVTVKIKISKNATKVHSQNDLNLFIKKCKEQCNLVGKSFFSIWTKHIGKI